MSSPDSYVRAGIVSVVFFALVFLRLLQNYGSNWTRRHTAIAILILGFAMAITTAIVGTISRRSEKPWPWVKVGAFTFGCALAVLLLMLLIQQNFYLK